VRVGIQTAQWGATFEEVLAVWQYAERAGYRSAWLMDHFVPVVAPSTEPMLESWVTLAALLARTSTIRGGVLVSANTFRHPALLAHMAATADRISGGRLEVGLGAAWNAEEHVARGIAFPPTGDRMGMLEEACQVLRLLWTAPVADFAGAYYRLDGATCEPKPVQGRLPLLIGGRGERRTLRAAARYADRWNGSGSVEMLVHSAAVLREHCAREARNPADVALTVMNECHVSDDPDDVRAHLEEAARFRRVSVDDVRERVWVGSPEDVRGQLAAFADAGFDEAILGLNPPYGARTFEMLDAVMG